MMKNEEDMEYSFYRYLIGEGYFFNKYVVENYLLSLKVKRFIILTGNSGTGKTKLSQLFAKFIDEYGYSEKDYLTVSVKSNFSSWSNKAWTLSSINFENIFPIKECLIDFKMTVDGIPADGSLYPTIQLRYYNDDLRNYFKKKFEEDQNQDIDIKIDHESLRNLRSDEYCNPNGSIILNQKSNKSSYEDRQWMVNKAIYEYIPFNQGQIPCNIVVDGIKSQGDIRIIFKLNYKKNEVLQKYLKQNIGKEVKINIKIDEWDFKNFKSDLDLDNCDNKYLSQNYQIVPVGANWTDNTNILGYQNVLTGDYYSTPAYKLIEQAEKHREDPYFLILDEMNLSHVERYFSDFLSVIESGENIPLYGIENSLKIPRNIFIIGTVNVDETTYMFSPKVLDRANTIEFDTLLAKDYMSLEVDDDDFKGDLVYLQSPLEDSDISSLRIDELKEILSGIVYGEENLWDILACELTKFQEALKGSGFDFGFRVINEILRFMVVSWRYENSPMVWNNWERYFDTQIKQKILPKLHGSEKVMGKVLTKLFYLCLNDINDTINPKNFYITENNSKYYHSALKLQNMHIVLSERRYVSFIN